MDANVVSDNLRFAQLPDGNDGKQQEKSSYPPTIVL